MKTKDKAVIFLAIFGLFTCLTDGVQAAHIHKVLMLNSYHPTYEWTKLIVDGIESTLQQYSDRIEMDIEYMDTRHFEEDETHYENFYALYKHKARRRQYDVIITSDNDALSFVLQHRIELYPNIPVVFCGVGSFNGPMLEGQSNITGVIEERSVGSTVEIALKFHPSAKQVVFISNAMSVASPQLERQLAEIIERFKGRAEFVKSYLSEFNTAELLKIIGGLGDESIVVFTSSFKDAEGNLYGFEDEAAMLSEQCLAPIYVISKEWLGIGPVVGGKVSSASHQGRTAAEMAIRILDGENARNIPIVRDSPHWYMFDYIQMKHFGIPVSDLPKGSVIVNEPKSFYYLYKKQIWTVSTIIAALTAVIVVLSINNLRRRQAEKKLFDYQRQLKSLASELSLTEERERRRIATNLHDRISQSLVISKVKLEQLRESASSRDLANALAEVCDSLDQTIQNTRSLTSDLSSPILYELGFEAAVAEWLAEQIQQRHDIATEFEDDGQPKPLDDDICALLFRNVRELLVNVVKHAHAHKVKVSIWKVNSEVHVSVEDDGVGFNPAGPASVATKTGGFGLFSIRERLEQVGGRLQIESAPGSGTKITVTAPLKQEEISSEARE